MIDLISNGAAWCPDGCAGAGSEQLANNGKSRLTQTASTSEEGRRLHPEGVDQAGTVPLRGGKHFHFRFVNPWGGCRCRRPHPPIWIPGLISPDNCYLWCAKKRFFRISRSATKTRADPPRCGISTPTRAAREGYQAGPENLRLSAGRSLSAIIKQRGPRETWKTISLRERPRIRTLSAPFPEWMFPPGITIRIRGDPKRLRAGCRWRANLPGKPTPRGAAATRPTRNSRYFRNGRLRAIRREQSADFADESRGTHADYVIPDGLRQSARGAAPRNLLVLGSTGPGRL